MKGWAQKTFASMTPEQKLGQLMVSFLDDEGEHPRPGACGGARRTVQRGGQDGPGGGRVGRGHTAGSRWSVSRRPRGRRSIPLNSTRLIFGVFVRHMANSKDGGGAPRSSEDDPDRAAGAEPHGVHPPPSAARTRWPTWRIGGGACARTATPPDSVEAAVRVLAGELPARGQLLPSLAGSGSTTTGYGNHQEMRTPGNDAVLSNYSQTAALCSTRVDALKLAVTNNFERAVSGRQRVDHPNHLAVARRPVDVADSGRELAVDEEYHIAGLHPMPVCRSQRSHVHDRRQTPDDQFQC